MELTEYQWAAVQAINEGVATSYATRDVAAWFASRTAEAAAWILADHRHMAQVCVKGSLAESPIYGAARALFSWPTERGDILAAYDLDSVPVGEVVGRIDSAGVKTEFLRVGPAEWELRGNVEEEEDEETRALLEGIEEIAREMQRTRRDLSRASAHVVKHRRAMVEVLQRKGQASQRLGLTLQAWGCYIAAAQLTLDTLAREVSRLEYISKGEGK